MFEYLKNDEKKDYYLIFMELCKGGDLLNYVKKRRLLEEPIAK